MPSISIAFPIIYVYIREVKKIKGIDRKGSAFFPQKLHRSCPQVACDIAALPHSFE